MGKYDKDRFQKELAIRYCLARGVVPFLEVVVRSIADLSDSVEILTDLDVLGIETLGDGGLRRTIFDCKTTIKLSSINRAFWAAGVKEYTGCNEAYVLVKGKAVHNHRISALAIDVDLHDEQSFKDLGRTFDQAFPADDCYQAAIVRWNAVFDCYAKNGWAENLFDLSRNVVPLSRAPRSTFRRILVELRAVRGHVDPAKDAHLAIFFDVLASAFVLWAAMGRDIRRFYEPSMEKAVFETGLRYYLWGGKESYNIRQQMRERAAAESAAHTEKTAEIDHGSAHLPAFDRQKCDKTEGPPGSSCFGTLRRHEFPRGEKSLFPSIIGRRKPCNFLHKRNLPVWVIILWRRGHFPKILRSARSP